MKNYLNKINALTEKFDKKINEYGFLSGNAIKVIAIITMFIDHFSKIYLGSMTEKVWIPMLENGKMSFEYWNEIDKFIRFILYGIGSIAFPLFCFLLVEGFCHTKNRKRYFCLIGIFAIISELPFDIGIFSEYSIIEGTYPFYFGYQNVFFTLFLGLCSLWCIQRFNNYSTNTNDRVKGLLLQGASISVISLTALLIRCDYNIYGILLIVGFYICRKNHIYQVLIFMLIYMVTSGNQPTIYMLISCLIILFYNGNRGTLNLKYFFYIFYPAHIALIHWATSFINPFH